MKSLLCIASLSVAIVASPAAFAQNALGVGTGISNSRSTSAAVANPVQNNRNTATAASASQSRSNSNSNLNSNIRSTTVSANQSSAGNSNTFNSTTTGLAPAVFAPGMSAAGIESCNGSISLGGSAVGGGGALGFPWQDGPCNKRLNARTLWAFGQREAAVQVLCQDDEIASALIASGVRCRIGRYAEPYTTHVSANVYKGDASAMKAQARGDYYDKAGRRFTVASCATKGARKSADAGVCVKTASN